MSWKAEDNFGIIDIGSNTVRGVVYYGKILKTSGGSVAFKSNILEETSEGVLSSNGIESLIGKIKKLLDYFAKNGAKKAYAFATSAMRDVTNFDEVSQAVLRETGVRIELISGDREAEYDYLALKSISGGKGGIGVDLGGGSAQVVVFDKKGVIEAASFPIGVKRVRKSFCAHTVPTADELSEIDTHIKAALAGIKGRSHEVWFMGGTAKAVMRAADELLLKNTVTVADLDSIYDIVSADITLLKRIFGKRYDTIPVGMQVMKSITECFGAEEIKVTEVGVRDGYVAALYKNKGERRDV